jgi:peptidoglycan/LPS O-acetylase OafA/YrhL
MKKQIDSLTGLRGVAALAVVGCHLSGELTLPLLKATIAQGWIAVDLFFILSGYILAYTYPDAAKGYYRQFLLKRLARIYPVHLVTFLLTFTIYTIALRYNIHLAAGGSGSVYEFFRHLTLTQAWFNYRSGLWNGASWSLSAEWFVYLLFPVLFMQALKPRRPLLAFILLLVFYVFVSETFAHTNSAFMFKTAIPRVTICFTIGILAWRLRNVWSARVFGYIADAVTLLLPATALVLALMGLWAWYLVPLMALWVWSLGSGKGYTGKALSHPVMVWLGTISYSLYLVHGPMVELYKFFLPGMSPLLQVATMISAAYVLYAYVEVPARHAIISRFSIRH